LEGGCRRVSASGHNRSTACKCDHTLYAHYTVDLFGLNTKQPAHRAKYAFPDSKSGITCQAATNAYKLIIQGVSPLFRLRILREIRRRFYLQKFDEILMSSCKRKESVYKVYK